jgi:chromosome segregation ATPase
MPSLTLALQNLLYRHEAYVADSERERREMVATIESLERDKMELEAKNAQTIKANRDLLDQLETLNSAVADSDASIQALEDTLRSAEHEIERLNALAARTQILEQQLIDLEREQAYLQTSLDNKMVDERTAIQRWRNAERTIGDLQDSRPKQGRRSRAQTSSRTSLRTSCSTTPTCSMGYWS